MFKELKNFYNENTSFSFCSNNNKKVFDNKDLSITNSPLEILSSYDNLNQISKGQYLSDFKFQNIIKNKIKKKYYDSNSNNNSSLSLNFLEFSSDDEKLNNKNTKKLKNKNKYINKKEKTYKKRDNKYLTFKKNDNNNILSNRFKLNHISKKNISS